MGIEINKYIEKPEFITDLANFDKSKSELHIKTDVKNLQLLKEFNLDKIWLIGAKEKDIDHIFSLIQPKYVNLYHFQAKDLKCLESLVDCETLIIEWNTKAQSLWDISANKKLRKLSISDFSKISDWSELESASQIRSLALDGGFGKALNVNSLNPISKLEKLEFLSLMNIKLSDESLAPIEELNSLKILVLSNKFPTKEYARLSVKLRNTKCNLFRAHIPVKITGEKNELVYDTMITGKRKPFLLSSIDFARIEKYEKDFEKLRNTFMN